MTYPIPTPGATPPAAVPAPPVNPPVPAPPVTPPAPAPAPPVDPLDEPLGESGLRALHNEREARKEAERQRKALQDQIDAINAQNMTELQRTQAQLATITEQFETAQRNGLRSSIAVEFSISGDDLVFLTGTTEEELRAQATRLKARIDAQPPAPVVPAFAPNPGQAAGNGNPPPPNTATVDAGRALYQQRNTKSN